MRLLNLLGMVLNTTSQSRTQNQYTGDVDRQIEDALRVASTMGPEALRTYDASARQARDILSGMTAERNPELAGYQQAVDRNRLEFLKGLAERGGTTIGGYESGLQRFLDSLEGRRNELLSGYGDRYARAAEDLASYGEQQKRDIDRRFDDESGRVMQDLIGRGLASSTVGAGDLLGVTERRSAEQRRLGEDLARMRIGILSGLSGDTLNAAQQLGSESAAYQYGGLQAGTGMRSDLDRAMAEYDAILRGQSLDAMGLGVNDWNRMNAENIQNRLNLSNWLSGNAANRSNLVQGGYGNMLDTLMNINRVPPPNNQLNYQFGASSVQGPQVQSNWYDSIIPSAVGSAAGSATGFALNRIFPTK